MSSKAVPTLVKVATGNRGRQALPVGEPMPDGALIKPSYLEGHELELWDEMAAMCFWLKAPDSPKLAAWCRLQADFETEWRKWSAPMWSQWRVLGSELGLDPSSRARMGMVKRGTKAEDPAAKYFTRAA